MSLGRSRGCTVTLRDPSASRNHALLFTDDAGLRLRDLGSSNGTFVNGQRVDGEIPLSDGDRITIGETEIKVAVVGAVAVAAPPDNPSATVRIPFADTRCPACNGPMPVGATLCPSCGTPLTAAPASLPQPPSLPEPPAAVPRAGTLPPPPNLPPPTAPPAPPTGEQPVPTVAPAPSPKPAASVGGAQDVLPSIGDYDLKSQGPPAVPAPPAAPVVAPAAPPRRPATTPAPRFLPAAGFWIRLLAVVLDALWEGAILAVVMVLPLGGRLQAVVSGLLGLLLGLAVPIIGWGRFGTTPGKAVLGLRVCTVDGESDGLGYGRAALRLVGYWLSGLLLGVGFLMIGLTAAKRGLHDHLAGTYVGRRR